MSKFKPTKSTVVMASMFLVLAMICLGIYANHIQAECLKHLSQRITAQQERINELEGTLSTVYGRAMANTKVVNHNSKLFEGRIKKLQCQDEKIMLLLYFILRENGGNHHEKPTYPHLHFESRS